MKTIKKLACLAGALAITTTVMAGDADSLIALDKKWGGAESPDEFASMISDDILAIGPEGMGGKAQMLAPPEDGDQPAGPYEAENFKVHFLNDDVAVMVHSTPGDTAHWSMHVWHRVDGNWVVAATASVPITE